MDVYEINLNGDLNVIQMDLLNNLFPKGDEQILNQETALDKSFFFSWIYKRALLRLGKTFLEVTNQRINFAY